MIDLPGTTVKIETLDIAKARALAVYLSSGANAEAVLLDVLRDGTSGSETIVFRVQVEVSQLRKHDIWPLEELAATFDPKDETIPEVVSLRESFPYVPHLNLRMQEFPRSLCLYDVGYDALKLRWTAAAFIGRVKEWLSETAEGRLHKADQPLEPLILGAFLPLLMPADFYDAVGGNAEPKAYTVFGLGGASRLPTGYALQEITPHQATPSHFATVMVAGPRQQGTVRRTPANLKDLIVLCREDGFDLAEELRKQLPRWRDRIELRQLNLVLVIVFPKVREGDKEATELDTLAFVLNASLESVGEHLGLWFRSPDGSLGAVLGPQDDTSDHVGLSILNPMLRLSKERSARFNGVETVEDSYLMVGVGALGSMVLGNLTRKGFGFWKVIDKDTMLPHNGARHLLPGDASGYPKALGVKTQLDAFYEPSAVTEVAMADVLHPGEGSTVLGEWFGAANAIVDCSADVPVARYLAIEAPGAGRRASAFLNPSGEDLVLLIEDSKRAVRLDELEMQYYAMLLEETALSEHLSSATSKLRYGRSCRDLTAILSNDAISRNAAIASRTLAEGLSQEEAQIKVWKGLPDGGVRAFGRAVIESTRLQVGDVVVVWHYTLAERVRTLRAQSLPRETGGCLLGQWDQSRKILYLVAATAAPSDSVEEAAGFIRGANDLLKVIEAASSVTGASVQYVGEWHSHPDGCAVSPSGLDRTLFTWLARQLAVDDSSPAMLIVGANELRWVLAFEGQEATWKFPS